MRGLFNKITSLLLAVAITATAWSVIIDSENEASAEEGAIVWSFEVESDVVFEKGKTYYYIEELSEVATGAVNELTITTTADSNSKDKLDATNKRIAIINAESSYITYTPSENGQLVANVKGMDIRRVTDSGDVVLASNTSTDTPSDISAECEADTTYKIITNSTKYGGLYSLKFIPGEIEATPEPTAMPIADEYSSPSTVWDFDSYTPALIESDNIPYISGTAVYDIGGEIKMSSDTKDTGYVTLRFNEPISGNMNISFDFIRHENNLNGQHMMYRIVNSVGEEIVSLDSVLYNSTGTGLKVCGEQIATDAEFKEHIEAISTPTTIKTSIDYYAGTVTVTVGDYSFTGTVSGGTIEDIALFEFSSSRTSTSSGRYLSFDNLLVEEFVSTATPAPESEFISMFEEKTICDVAGRVNAPSDYAEKSYPLVIFLHGENRVGEENKNQLYDAEILFKTLKGKAVLAAPQTASDWDKDIISAYISAAEEQYNASGVIVAGYSMGAEMCWQLALSGGISKIVPIAGVYSFSTDEIDAVKDNDVSVWAFSGYKDEQVSFADIRSTVNAFQKAGIVTEYTEFPLDGHAIYKKAEATDGLAEWILNDGNIQKTVDLVLFAGQSNMAGRGDYEDATVCPPGQGYEFHSVTNSLTYDGYTPMVLSTVSEPFGKYENNSVMNDSSNGNDRRNGDMVSSVMKAYYDETGIPMVGVQASRGGQKTDYFMSDSIMTEMQDRYNSAEEYLEEAGYTIRKKLIVWCQGCSDADSGRTADEYKTNLMSIFTELSQETGITDMFIVKIGHYNPSSSAPAAGATPESDSTKDAAYKIINGAQQELADENDNIYIAANLYTDHYFSLMRDHYHYYQTAYNEIGAETGKTIAEVYAESEPDPTPPPVVDENVRYDSDENKAVITLIAEKVATVIFASYNENGELRSISVKEKLEIPAGTSYIVPDENFIADTNVKVYVWENLMTIKPIF